MDQKHSRLHEHVGETRRTTESYERYDLTGHTIRRWTVQARNKLLGTLRRLISWGRSAGETQLPGTDESVGQKIAKLPGKAVEFAESEIEKTTIENELKTTQTETEFLKQELLREQITKTQAETRNVQLDNVAREIEIRERISEITTGKTTVQIVATDDGEVVVIGNLADAENNQAELMPPSFSIDRLKLSKRVRNILHSNEIATAQELALKTHDELLSIDDIGPKTVEVIEAALMKWGMKLQPKG